MRVRAKRAEPGVRVKITTAWIAVDRWNVGVYVESACAWTAEAVGNWRAGLDRKTWFWSNTRPLASARRGLPVSDHLLSHFKIPACSTLSRLSYTPPLRSSTLITTVRSPV